MKKLLISFTLLIVAVYSIKWLIVPAIIAAIANGIRYKNLVPSVTNSVGDGAYALDVFGNVNFDVLLNALFCGRGGYLHGMENESISSVLGKRQSQGTNVFLGEGMTGFLNLIDRGDHCYRAALKNDPAWPLPMPTEPIAWYKTATVIAIILAIVTLQIFF